MRLIILKSKSMEEGGHENPDNTTTNSDVTIKEFYGCFYSMI